MNFVQEGVLIEDILRQELKKIDNKNDKKGEFGLKTVYKDVTNLVL